MEDSTIKVDDLKLGQDYEVSLVRFAEILSNYRTSGLWFDGGDVPRKGRNGYLLTDHLPPIKMTKIHHRLREIQKENIVGERFEMRFGKWNQWATGILVGRFTSNDTIVFFVEQFGEDYTQKEIEMWNFKTQL